MEKMINCIIVDDEPLSLDILEKYIGEVPFLSLQCNCSDAFEALEAIQKYNVDLIFLDINMPKLSGLQMLRTLTNPPDVIFTTAYPEFAVAGFEADAIDYLLKPFDFERFLKAVNKCRKDNDRAETAEKVNKDENVIWLKSDRKLHRVLTDDILFIEAVGDYLKVVCDTKTLIVHETLHAMEENLSEYNFCRIHRSYIIPIDKLEFIEGNRVGISGSDFPVGQKYRDEFLDKVKALRK
ncbi:MAG: LytTR family DNA-binding domain-containing protein [Bacteroidales bacterium]|nr:LytTR family DNA-binding domain-containing protein [Bacteroidales bacterium]